MKCLYCNKTLPPDVKRKCCNNECAKKHRRSNQEKFNSYPDFICGKCGGKVEQEKYGLEIDPRKNIKEWANIICPLCGKKIK